MSDARTQIYLPYYRWVLDNRLEDLIDVLRGEAEHKNVVLLDYSTNGDVGDVRRPLSHAHLVAPLCRCGLANLELSGRRSGRPQPDLARDRRASAHRGRSCPAARRKTWARPAERQCRARSLPPPTRRADE